jgi:transposase InsO family protein
MTTQQKLIQQKLSLLELGEFLNNVSDACRIHGCSRQHFYDIKKAYLSQGIDGLKEKSRRKPNHKNRVAPEIEDAVLLMAFEYPAYGQLRASNELRKQGVLISSGGIRSIWLRHGLETFKKRLKALEEKAAKEGVVYTEEQLRVLEQARKERETVPDEIETHHPGYLLAQDTFYVGYLKGVGRIYQQTVIDTYSAVAFAKLYTAKVPLTAADALNDKVVPFFDEQNVDILRILTDRGTEFCGRLDKHPYQLYLQLHEIDHTRTKARHPQTNGICERFHKTVLDEFYKSVFRKKIFDNIDDLQVDLDTWIEFYNRERTHQGKRCQGKTPMQTFIDGMKLADKANLENEEKLTA